MPDENPKIEIQAELNAIKLISNVHDALDGIIKLSQGGAEALEGLAVEGALVTEVFEGMLGPLAPVLMAITELASIAIPLWQQYSEKVKDGTDAENDFGAAATAASDAAKGHADDEKEVAEAIDKSSKAIVDYADNLSKIHWEVVTQQIRDYIAAQKDAMELQKTWDDNADKRLTYLQNETKATQDLTLAQMKRQERIDLNAATSDDQRAVIEADYKRKEIAVTGGNRQEANMAEQTLLSQQKQEDDSERLRLFQDNQDNRFRMADLKKQQDAAVQKLIDERFTPDEAGSFKGLEEGQKKKFESARKAAFAAQAKADKDAEKAAKLESIAALAESSPIPGVAAAARYAADLAEAAAQHSKSHAVFAQDTVTEERGKLADLRDVNGREDAMKDLTATMKETTKKIGELADHLDEIYSKQRVLSTESKTIAVETGVATPGQTAPEGTEQLAADAETDKKQADLHWKAWQEAQRQTEIKNKNTQRSEGAESHASEGVESAQDKADEYALSQLKSQEAQLKNQSRGGKGSHSEKIVATVESMARLQVEIAVAQARVDADHERRIQEAHDKAQKALDLVHFAANNAPTKWLPGPSHTAERPKTLLLGASPR